MSDAANQRPSQRPHRPWRVEIRREWPLPCRSFLKMKYISPARFFLPDFLFPPKLDLYCRHLCSKFHNHTQWIEIRSLMIHKSV